MLLYDANVFNEFEKKREEGENEKYICSLIRNDEIVEFISYVNQESISLSSYIKGSIFETNSFLIDKEPSILEYATFFGSIQIINYLTVNGIELGRSLWEYAIHSNNAEIINILEEKHIRPAEYTYSNCLLESIKCHHNDVAKYILELYCLKFFYIKKDIELKYFETSFQYYNFLFFPDIHQLSLYFYELYLCNHSKIMEYLVEEKERYI